MTLGRLATTAAVLAGLAFGPAASAAGRTQEVTWHGKQIRMYDAQAAGRDGAGVVVAVLDSWVDTKHPDFEGRARGAVDCVGGTCETGQARDSCTHGTHVAGTVGSSSFGVARKAIILPVRVLSADSQGECTGTPSDVAAGIQYAVEHDAKVINLSLGPDVQLLGGNAIPHAVQKAAASGAVVIFSAGNADDEIAQSYGSDALVVAATGPNGRLATYSQHGEGISVAAPGGEPGPRDACSQAICITSLYPGGKYAVAAGTSMAAPHVAGLAALLFGQKPTRGRENVMARITDTARPLAGAGSGLVDAKAALGVTSTPRPAPKPTVTKTTPPPAVKPHKAPPTRAPTAAPKPRPSVTAAPSPLPSATPSDLPSATPTPTASTPQALPAQRDDDDIPALLAGAAGFLIVLTGAGVLALPRLARR